MFAGKKSAQIREILINESAWEEMTCLFAPSLEDSSSEELLSDNTLEKDENSPDNGFEVGEYNTYEAYNSEKQYFTREDYTYDYDLLNAI
ncbi:DUF1471 domain-containing protein [Escherichia coli]|nr:DUF1471 domain-containing protein [Escherichia coli]